MIGKLRVTNIELRYAYTGGGKTGWWAEAKFQDEGWAQDNTIEGTLSTRYGQGIENRRCQKIRQQRPRCRCQGTKNDAERQENCPVDPGNGAEGGETEIRGDS